MNFHTVKGRYFIAFYNKSLAKNCLQWSCIFPHNLEQSQNVFAQGCVENCNA